MDIRKIKKLIELLEESSLSELEIIEGEESVRLSRGGAMIAPPAMQQGLPVGVQAAAWSAPAEPQAAVPAAAPAAVEDPEQEAVPEGELVRAPTDRHCRQIDRQVDVEVAVAKDHDLVARPKIAGQRTADAQRQSGHIGTVDDLVGRGGSAVRPGARAGGADHHRLPGFPTVAQGTVPSPVRS